MKKNISLPVICNLLHLICAIKHAHDASTRTTDLMRVKNSTHTTCDNNITFFLVQKKLKKK